MATTIKSISDLTKILEPRIQKAMQMTRDEIYLLLRQKVEEYYDEEPIKGWGSSPNYRRTYHLYDAASKSDVLASNGCFEFTVGFNNEYLSFQYPGWRIRWKRGNAGKNGVTGYEVLREQFNDHMHGNPNFRGRHDYWDELIEEIDDIGIENLFKKNCKKVGLPIK